MKQSTVFFLLTIIFTLVSVTTLLGAGTVRWTGGTSTEWSTAANWTTISGTPSTPPSSADDVQIGQAAITFQPSITSTTGAVTIKSLTYGSTATSTLTFTNGGAGSLTITGDLNMVQAGSSVPHTINVNDRSLTVQGNVIGIGANTGNAAGSSTINISTGTFSVTGSITINSRGTLAFSGAGTLNIGGDFDDSNTGTFTSGTSTVNFNGTSAQSILGPTGGGSSITFSTLKSNNNAGVTYSNATGTITISTLTIGDVTANSIFSDGGNQLAPIGTLNLTSGTFKFGGSAATTYPTITTPNISAGTTVEYASTAAQTVSGTPAYQNLTLSGGNTKTLQTGTTSIGGNLTLNGSVTATFVANISIAGDLSVNGTSTLNLSTFTANRASSGGTLTVANGATLNIGGINGFPSNYTTHSLGSTSTVNYSGSTQSLSAESYGHLTVNAAGTKTLAGTATVAGDLTVSAGTLDLSTFTLDRTASGGTINIGASSSLKIGGTNGFPTNYTTHTLNATSTVEYSGTTQTVSAESYGNLTLSGTGTKAVSGTTISTTNSLNISSATATFDLNAHSMTAGDIQGSGTITSGAAGSITLTCGGDNASTTFSGLIENGSGTIALTKSGTGALTLSGNNTYTGTTTISAGTLKLGAAGDGTNTPLGTTAAGTSVTGGAALDLNGFTLSTSEALTLNGTRISSGGALTNSSATGVSYSGLITLGSASSVVASAGDINITNTGTITGATFGLTLGGIGNGSLASIIGTTSGTVTKSGTGTWTLSASNTYTGTTTISAGTLKLGAAGDGTNTPLGTTAAGTSVTGGAALDLNGFTLGTR